MSWRMNKDCNILTPPQLFWLLQHFFPVLLGCSTGGLGTQPLRGHGSHSSIFSPIDLNFLSLGLYNNLTRTYFLRASHLHSIQPVKVIPWYLRPDPPVIYQVHFLFWQLGRGPICNIWPLETNHEATINLLIWQYTSDFSLFHMYLCFLRSSSSSSSSSSKHNNSCSCLVIVEGISTFVGYLMLNPVYTHTLTHTYRWFQVLQFNIINNTLSKTNHFFEV